MKKGFTLIELLTVASIIFLLTSVFISNAQESKLKAEDSAKVQQSKQISTAIELYKQSNGGYSPAKKAGLSSGLYKESTLPTSGYRIVMDELISNKNLSSRVESKDKESYYYYENENGEALLLTLLNIETDDGDDCVASSDEFECDLDEDDENILKLKKKTESDWTSYDLNNEEPSGQIEEEPSPETYANGSTIDISGSKLISVGEQDFEEYTLVYTKEGPSEANLYVDGQFAVRLYIDEGFLQTEAQGLWQCPEETYCTGWRENPDADLLLEFSNNPKDLNITLIFEAQEIFIR